MKKIFALGAILILLCSCGPTIRVGYNYTPPEDPEERSCVAACHIQKQKCEQKSESNYRKCFETNSDVLVYDYNTRQYGRYSRPGITCTKYDCVQSYNECFNLCGGTVESYLYETPQNIF